MSARRFAPRRELGRTGFVATQLGAGDLADASLPFDTCVATLTRALDAGVNVVDTAPSYEEGLSERIVGAALANRRDGVFLIDKIDHFDRSVAEQIEGSLERLGGLRPDLFVFHGVSTLEAWRALAAPGGRFDELASAVAAKKTRFRGISCHHPEVLREAIPSGLCDVVMFPVGAFVDERYVRGDAAAREKVRGGHGVLQDVRRRKAPRRHRGLWATARGATARQAELGR